MSKKLLIAQISFLLFVLFGLSSNNFTVAALSESYSQPALFTDVSAEIESVTLDKDVVYTLCESPEIIVDSMCSKDNARVKVTTKLLNNDEENLTFYYTVSGGEIIGQGSNVIWDLSNDSPGKYSITVGIGKNNIIAGKTLTKTVQKEVCICLHPCACPYNLSISGPEKAVKADDLIIFSANIDFYEKESFAEYNWKVLNGTIIEGQGTKQILVKANPEAAGKTVTASVSVGTSEFYCESRCGDISGSKSVNVISSNN